MSTQGGARAGAGRKSKAEEMGLPKLIEEVIGDKGKKAIIQALYDKSTGSKADVKAIALLMSYIFGKPSDSGIIPVDSDNIESVIINYIKPEGDKG